LPGPIIRLFYRLSRRAFNSLSSPQGRRSRNKNRAIVNSLSRAHDFVEICELFGYYAEEHIVQTKDGYLLGLHRLGWKHGEEEQRVNCGKGSIQKKVAYLHHGLLMNSEVWVCMTEQERCLPFQLVEKGYDVWVGHNRLQYGHC
jgi:lysosomal acid lipase/cholesteryl ester hydrolase